MDRPQPAAPLAETTYGPLGRAVGLDRTSPTVPAGPNKKNGEWRSGWLLCTSRPPESASTSRMWTGRSRVGATPEHGRTSMLYGWARHMLLVIRRIGLFVAGSYSQKEVPVQTWAGAVVKAVVGGFVGDLVGGLVGSFVIEWVGGGVGGFVGGLVGCVVDGVQTAKDEACEAASSSAHEMKSRKVLHVSARTVGGNHGNAVQGGDRERVCSI